MNNHHSNQGCSQLSSWGWGLKESVAQALGHCRGRVPTFEGNYRFNQWTKMPSYQIDFTEIILPLCFPVCSNGLQQTLHSILLPWASPPAHNFLSSSRREALFYFFVFKQHGLFFQCSSLVPIFAIVASGRLLHFVKGGFPVSIAGLSWKLLSSVHTRPVSFGHLPLGFFSSQKIEKDLK